MTIYTLPDYLLGRREVIATFVECNLCGLIYQNPRPMLEEMLVHYPPEYELYSPEAVPQDASWLLKNAIQYGFKKRARFLTRFKRSGRLLDVGCATGAFLKSMGKEGKWELYGVEFNEYAARIACEAGLKVWVGTLEQAKYPDDFFDAVTLWDVLEHLPDPLTSLREIYRILKPGGIIVARVPNANSRDARLFGRYWVGLEPPRHLYVFTSATLSAMLTKTNLRPIKWDGNVAAYTTFLLSVRFWASSQVAKNFNCDLLIKLSYHPVVRLLTAPFFYLRGMHMQGPLMVVTAIKCSQDTLWSLDKP